MSIASEMRPRSAVSGGTGIAGLLGLCAWFAVARRFGLDGPYSALASLIAAALPMILWSLLVDRVHRNASTGIDWDTAPRLLRETLDISLVKLAGLWATWGGIAIIYALGRWYWDGNYRFAMQCFQVAAPLLAAISIPYILWIDRRLVEPRDDLHAFGAWLIGIADDAQRARIPDHLRAWAVKGFFLAFMLSIVPGGFGEAVRTPLAQIVANPVALTQYLITAMFVIDVHFATVGYMLTLKPLDAHIRSATPYAAGWMAALICYPPFILMAPGGPLDNHRDTADWSMWMAGHPVLLAITGAVLVALTATYAWATVAFGIRFSNLTHRGILTHGPYAWVKHPAYLSKNLFWWLSSLPFLVTSGSAAEALRNAALLALIGGVYFWRAKTEERHLGADPAYQVYAAWIAEHGLWARLYQLSHPQPSIPSEVEGQSKISASLDFARDGRSE